MSMAHPMALTLARRPFRGELLAGLLAAVVAVAAVVAWQVARLNRDERESRFGEIADQVAGSIQERLQAYEYGLRGARGAVVAAGGRITRERFRAYSLSRDYGREFPGVQGYGFIQRVPVDGVPAFLAAVRREDGAPDFALRELGPNDGDRFVIRYLEPEPENRSAIGLDIASESLRRAAALQAARSGEVVLSLPITPARAGAQARRGFLLLLPVYREGLPLDTPDQRWAATDGWAYAGLRIERVLEGLDGTRQLYSLALSDLGEGAQAPPFFRSADGAQAGGGLSARRTIEVYNRSWALTLQARPAMAGQFKQVQPWAAAAVTLAIGGLGVASLYLWRLGRERRRAVGWYQARIAALVDSSADAIIACDTQGLVTHWNRAAEALLDRRAEAAIGQPLAALLAGSGAPVGAGGDVQSLADASLRLPQRDGRAIDAVASVAPIRDPQGATVGTSVILHDMSERVRAEERFRLVVEATPNAILMVDAGGIVSLANARAEELFGYSRAELLGSSINQLLDSATRAHHDGFIRAYFAQPQARAMGAGRDLYGQRRDGTLVPVEIGLNPIETANGRYTLASIIDITERKRHEARIMEMNATLEQQVQERTQQIRTYSARLQAILEHAGYAIIAVGTDGIVTLFNPEAERMLGYRAHEMVGRRNIACLHSADELQARAAALSARLGQPVGGEFVEIAARATQLERDIGEWTYLRQDGTPLPVTLSISTLRDEHGAATGYLVLASDLSEQKRQDALLRQATSEARQANQYKSDFLANMSHEIRTPMNAILGMVYLLEKLDLPATARDMVHKINGSARSLLSIINDVLDFSKIEAGRIELEDEPFDLAEVLEDVASLMATAVGDKPVEMVVSPAPPTARYLRGDSLRLNQVLVNLVGNAIKFTERGEVVLSVAQLASGEPGRVRLAFSVTDTGIGIPTEKQRHIFSPFGQVDSSTTRKYGGTGLGLSICRRLVELMGGELRVDSQPGQGSRFHFEISLAQGEPVERGPHGDRPYRVLVVDDHGGARANLSLIVEGFGWKPVAVASGEEAVRAAAAARGDGYDIVLMDWRMPGMDGLQATVAIREDVGAGQHQPVVIMVTAYEREQIERDARSFAVDAVLTKPATASTLFNAIMDALSRRGRAVAPPRRDSKARRLAGIRLLVVDDSEINREVAQRILEGEGAEVELAGDGREAIAAIARQPGRFDAVLMDVQMPEMDGYEATRQIRGTPAMAALPVIALTAGAFKRQQEAALAAGMNAFIAKPFDVSELVSVICQMVPERAGLRRRPAPAGAGAPGPARAGGVDPQVLDLDKGLAYWNDGIRYRQYLAQFARDYAQSAQDVADMLRRGETDPAAAYLHRMRGGAGSLMLPGIAAASAEIEAVLEAGADASDRIEMLERAVTAGLAEIGRYLSAAGDDAGAAAPAAAGPAGTAVAAESAPALAELLRALDTDDPNQVERALAGLAGAAPAEWLDELTRRVQAFDFRAAEAWVLARRDGVPDES